MNIPKEQKANIFNFDPSVIEQMLAKKDWNSAWQYLGEVLGSLTITSSAEAQRLGSLLQKDLKDETQRIYINNFGALLGELLLFLLVTENVNLNDKSFSSLIFFHETLHTLFYVYSLDDTDHYIAQIRGDGKKKLSASQQKKMLLLLSLNTKLDIEEILNSVDANYRHHALIGYFSHRKIFREGPYNNKAKLYKFRNQFDTMYKDPNLFRNVIIPYFLCSYMNIANKHSIKENINAAHRNYLAETKNYRRIQNLPVHRDRFNLDKNKPTIVVVTDYFSRNHAMFRCWGHRTISLHSEFNVILCISADYPDASLKSDFPEYHTFTNVPDLYQLIHDAQPDIVFMPSIGMRFYTMHIANIRMAPIQIMGLGHPATSMSKNIDYVVGPGSIYDERAFPQDTYVNDLYPGNYIPLFSKEQFFQEVPKTLRPDKKPNTIYIGVVGTDIKVSYPFFKFLKELVKESPFEIHVSFLMAVSGIDSIYLEKYLNETFENFTYYGMQSYVDYMDTIKNLDIILNPFPFGHTNTIIDSLMCGKPCIGLDGIEPASKSEGDVLDTVGLKEAFVAKDEADYKEKFFAMAKRILSGDNDFFDREKIYERLFKEPENYDYGKIFKWISDNHNELKNSDKKYFEAFQDI